MQHAPDDVAVAAALVADYHRRTKHHLQRYAAGPETLDWDAQPDPFRRYIGAPLRHLPLAADALDTPWSAVCDGSAPAQPIGLGALAAFFELSFGLTAWKQHGPDRWALRANPSSGNLHPTEAYLLAHSVYGLEDGLYHYAAREHALELRATGMSAAMATARDEACLWIGLSSVQWREAWKYGERAFRYCQLDTGHAVGAVRYAAAALGWQARVVQTAHRALAGLLGLDRDADFGNAEREEPELLMQLGPELSTAAWPDGVGATWHGQANRLDGRPMYRWPVIDEVARATRRQGGVSRSAVMDAAWAPQREATPATRWAPARGGVPAAALIRGRRSAQHFERRAVMPRAALERTLRALSPDAGLPWDAWPVLPHVHLVCWVHRVDGLEPGAYLLPRDPRALPRLQAALHSEQPWTVVAGFDLHTPLLCIAPHPALAGTLRTLSCHQAIASDACVAFSLLAEFGADGAYRERLQEAGLIGQVLYLQAEAEGLRGTGIGCYFDDAVHELLGLRDEAWQVLYHFTIGQPLVDHRIITEPPYARRAPMEPSPVRTP